MANKSEYLKRLSLKNPWHFIALGFGSGLAPVAPGTFGSLAALPFCYALIHLPLSYQIIVILLSFILGTIACQKAENAMGLHDHGGIVIDEFVGMFISVLAFPTLWYSVFLGFILFRIFDITKPLFIGYADRKLKGGLGIMVDDVLAGLCALALGQIIWSALL